ncbi:hypothetical protein DL769_008761 [Monosporascus sp. CRB-8-3]|nr:hypothetical protein DL769_008761 [Monosporascus sp. CRB-8-3]
MASAALPAEGSALTTTDLVTSKLTWTGQIKPAESSVTSVGTAEGIYRQIIETAPTAARAPAFFPCNDSSRELRYPYFLIARVLIHCHWTTYVGGNNWTPTLTGG